MKIFDLVEPGRSTSGAGTAFVEGESPSQRPPQSVSWRETLRHLRVPRPRFSLYRNLLVQADRFEESESFSKSRLLRNQLVCRGVEICTTAAFILTAIRTPVLCRALEGHPNHGIYAQLTPAFHVSTSWVGSGRHSNSISKPAMSLQSFLTTFPR